MTEEIDVRVNVEGSSRPQVYMHLLCKDHGMLAIVIFERAPGDLSAAFSAGQSIPAALRPKPHAAGLTSLKAVEEWALSVGRERGVELQTFGEAFDIKPQTHAISEVER